MWIESHPSFSIRWHFVSPPGYQSPALGDSIPVPWSQEAQRKTLQPRASTSTLCHVPLLFASIIPSRIHQEVDNEQQISQWWRHCRLHQHEVLECLTMEETWGKPNKVDCELTMVSTPSTLLHHTRSQADGTSSNDLTKPLLVCTPAAFKGNENLNSPSKSWIVHMPTAFKDYKSEDSSSSSATLIASSRATSHSVDSCQSKRVPLITLTWSSLPNHESYARHIYSTLNYSVLEEPPPMEMSSLERQTLAFGTPGNSQTCIYPDSQLALFKQGSCQQTTPSSLLMSSVTPSTGDNIHQNKTHNTNSSASWDLVTLLTTKRKGKGVSMTEEPDPEADSPVNVSPMPASGLVLTGPHPPDMTNLEEATLSPAASQHETNACS